MVSQYSWTSFFWLFEVASQKSNIIMKELKMTKTCNLDSWLQLRVTLWLALAEVALLTLTRKEQTPSAKNKKVQWSCDIAVVSRAVDLLPALTLTVFNEGQLNELVLHEGGLHQLRSKQKNCLDQQVYLEAIECVYLGWYLHSECVCV